MAWIMLAAAIAFEVAGTLSLKKSHGFDDMAWGGAAICLYVVSLVLLAQALRVIDVGIAYAIWAAVGTGVVAVGGIMIFGEAASPLKLVCIALIIAGVAGLRLSANV